MYHEGVLRSEGLALSILNLITKGNRVVTFGL